MIKQLSFTLLVSCLFISLPLQAKKKAKSEQQVKKSAPDKAFVYKTIDKHKLKMHQFSPENYRAGQDKRPAIIFFFGGGWTGGKPAQFYQQARFFADRGFVTFCPEYRIKKKHKSSPFDAVADAHSAVRYLRANAKKLGINPQAIIASGGSAGGHLAVCTAMIKPDEKSPISAVPNAVMAFNPVLDTTEKGYGLSKVGENRQHDISPCHKVRKGLPPMIVLVGTKDTCTPYENAVRFTKLMHKAGNRCDLKSYEGRNHGFFNSKQFRAKSNGKDNAATNIECEDFLRSLGFLK